jgi:hypothetical protein
MKLKAEQYTPMPIGDYPARFTGYEEDEGVHGPCVKSFFTILNGASILRSSRSWCG